MTTISKANHITFYIDEVVNSRFKHLRRRIMKYIIIGPSLLKRTIYLAKMENFKQVIPKRGRANIQFETKRHWLPMKWK